MLISGFVKIFVPLGLGSVVAGLTGCLSERVLALANVWRWRSAVTADLSRILEPASTDPLERGVGAGGEFGATNGVFQIWRLARHGHRLALQEGPAPSPTLLAHRQPIGRSEIISVHVASSAASTWREAMQARPGLMSRSGEERVQG
ncbi:MAG TPA: hypothetical protein VN113_10990 [Caulobacter sp.]|nr:hypothetical protein [Caulobacter sp.]